MRWKKVSVLFSTTFSSLERLFRFIAYLFLARDIPEYTPDWLVEAGRTVAELKEDLYHVEGLPLRLREVSTNSTRVRDAAIEPENPPAYEDDIFVDCQSALYRYLLVELAFVGLFLTD